MGIQDEYQQTKKVTVIKENRILECFEGNLAIYLETTDYETMASKCTVWEGEEVLAVIHGIDSFRPDNRENTSYTAEAFDHLCHIEYTDLYYDKYVSEEDEEYEEEEQNAYEEIRKFMAIMNSVNFRDYFKALVGTHCDIVDEAILNKIADSYIGDLDINMFSDELINIIKNAENGEEN